MTKPIIAIDVDDTLSQHLDLRKIGVGADSADVYKMDWKEIMSDPEQLAQLLKRAATVAQDLPPIHGALDALRKLQPKYDFIVLSARPEQLKDATERWIDANFPDIFAKRFFSDSSQWSGGNEMKEALAKNKAEICQREGAEFLIDDQLVNCAAAMNVGVKSVLFGDSTDAKDVPAGVTAAKTWLNVAEYFDGRND